MHKENLSESQFLAQFEQNSPMGSSISLNPEESAHAVKVFRHRVGDLLRIGNGHGLQGVGIVSLASISGCVLELQSIAPQQPRPHLHLAIGCLKDNDLEEVMESCGQLNLASLTLLRTDHSQEPKDSDLGRTVRRLEMKSLVAFKQSQKSWLTTVHGPIPFSQWVDQSQDIILCDMHGSPTLSFSGQEQVLAVGPEGGFSPREIEAMKAHHCQSLRIGTTRLRAKTCPIVAMGALLAMPVSETNRPVPAPWA